MWVNPLSARAFLTFKNSKRLFIEQVKGLSIEKRRPPLTAIFLWIIGVLTLVLTGYGIFTGVVLAVPFPYNILIVINSTMIGIVEIFVGALIDMHTKWMVFTSCCLICNSMNNYSLDFHNVDVMEIIGILD